MRADVARADRNAAVRAAARSWRRAGVIDDVTLTAIEAEAPDDRVRVGPVFRVLLFIFTLIAITAAFGFVAIIADIEEQSAALVAIVSGIALAVITEVQTGPLRRAQGGTEAATSFAALVFLCGGAAWFLTEAGTLSWPDRLDLVALGLLGAALAGGAAWRWGFPLYAGAAMASLLFSLAFLPAARWQWIAVPLAFAPVFLRLSDSPRLPPAHRAACTVALLVGLAGLYLAVHLGSVDAGLTEDVGGWVREGPTGWKLIPRWLSILATALVPAAFLGLGLRQRRRPLLLLGLAAGAVSLATFYYYAEPGPLWLFLTLCGLAAIAAALAIRRFLDAAPDHERGGFTAEPLFDDPEAGERLETAASVVTLTPEARAAHEEPGFKGEGGEFGGGGASGSW
jgi:hypothetical protein